MKPNLSTRAVVKNKIYFIYKYHFDNQLQMSELRRQPRGRRTQKKPAAAGSAEQAAEPTETSVQDQLVAAVTDKVLEALKNNQKTQQEMENGSRGRKRHREQKKKRRRMASPDRSNSSSGTNSDSDESSDESSPGANTSNDDSSSEESDNDESYLLSTPISAQIESKIKNKI
ncbi:hepatoma-derived growth factor-related protein 2-like isoform X2 [Saccostrea cucullata]|uniref:hepatoma-derived growth factor-related protein 2-like n=1 Tax=Saccostrea cuccullata TaxID=36930 RepID=UPI002ED427D8